MSAKSLIRYRSTVGGEDPLSSTGPPWPSDKESSVKKSSMRDVGSVSETSSNNRLEEDNVDEGIDDILAQVSSQYLVVHFLSGHKFPYRFRISHLVSYFYSSFVSKPRDNC